MKIKSYLCIAVCLTVLAGFPAGARDTHQITSSINFVHVPINKVLDVYEASAKCELVIASNVQSANHNITLHAENVSPQVIQQMLEQALLKQAGIMITHLDDKRVSVTYNDRLETKP